MTYIQNQGLCHFYDFLQSSTVYLQIQRSIQIKMPAVIQNLKANLLGK